MAKYTLELNNRSAKNLKKLEKGDKKACREVTSAIDDLTNNPRPHGCKAMTGYKDVYRIRVGMHYRVIYRVQDNKLKILVVVLSSKEDSDDELKKVMG